jgi:hypothetical protein
VVSLDFSVTYSFRPFHGPGVDSVPSENEYQGHFLGVKAAGAWGWRPHHLHVSNVMKIWEPKPLEGSGPHRACYGTPLPLPFYPKTNCWLQRFPFCTYQAANCSVSRYARNKLLLVGLQTYIAQTTNCYFCRAAPLKLSIAMFQPPTDQATGFGVSSILYRQYLHVLWYLKNTPVSLHIPQWRLLLCMDPHDWVCKKWRWTCFSQL